MSNVTRMDDYRSRGWSGTEEALRAARDGDIAALDVHELEWLNIHGPWATPPGHFPLEILARYGWELYALQMVRGGDRTEIRWGYKLGAADGDAIWTFRTDTQLNVVPGSTDNVDCPWRQWGGGE